MGHSEHRHVRDKINRKLPVFISPVVDDEALEVDALSIP